MRQVEGFPSTDFSQESKDFSIHEQGLRRLEELDSKSGAVLDTKPQFLDIEKEGGRKQKSLLRQQD